VKILADAKTDRVLGVQSCGGRYQSSPRRWWRWDGASAEDIARTCHAHPTWNEAVKEAALAVDGHAIHI